jgi:hypothetical protein
MKLYLQRVGKCKDTYTVAEFHDRVEAELVLALLKQARTEAHYLSQKPCDNWRETHGIQKSP